MPNAEARCIPAIAAEFSGLWGEKCQHQPVQPRKFPTHRGGLRFWSRFASWPRFIDEQALGCLPRRHGLREHARAAGFREVNRPVVNRGFPADQVAGAAPRRAAGPVAIRADSLDAPRDRPCCKAGRRAIPGVPVAMTSRSIQAFREPAPASKPPRLSR